MLSKRSQQERFDELTVRDLERLLERKKRNPRLAELMTRRDQLRFELARVEDEIEMLERVGDAIDEGAEREALVGDFAHARTHRGLVTKSSEGRSGNGTGAISSGSRPGLHEVGSRIGSRVNDFLPGANEVDHGTNGTGLAEEDAGLSPSFLAGKRRRNLKDYIAQVLLDAGEPLSPADIQERLPLVGYQTSATSHRSFYNTVFQALQRYEIFERYHRKYRLVGEALRDDGVAEILPKNKTRLKDFIVQVLDQAGTPLKVSEIASRVVIVGYDTDLEMDELQQRVAATLKKYLTRDFDWDGQRYSLRHRRR